MTLNNTWGFQTFDDNVEGRADPRPQPRRRRQQGGQLPAQRRAHRAGRHPGAERQTPRRDRQMDEDNAASIHGATAGPFKKLSWGRATTGHDGTLYLHAFVWPNGSDLIVPLKNQTTSVRQTLFPVQTRARASPGSSRTPHHRPPRHAPDPDAFDPVIALGLDGPVHDRPSRSVNATTAP